MLQGVVTTVLLATVLSTPFCAEVPADTVEIFHKRMPPSLKTLARTDSVLTQFNDEFVVIHHLITDSSTAGLIERYNLPSTHFPFAIVINGKCSATIGGEKIDFVHFPLFMHGIGRHEGNWSMKHLELVLKDVTLLIDENVLPELDESGDTKCMGEEAAVPESTGGA